MEIVFSCSIEDYIVYNDWYANRGRKNFSYWWARIMSATCGVAIPLLWALQTRVYWENQNIWKVATIVAGLFFVINFFDFPSARKRMVAAWIKEAYGGSNGFGHFGKRTVRLFDDYLWSKTDSEESKIAYRSVSQIIETPTYVFIRQGPSAHVIPRTKIETGDLLQFVEQLKKRVDAASANLDTAALQISNDKQEPKSDGLGVTAFVIAGLLGFIGIVPCILIF